MADQGVIDEFAAEIARLGRDLWEARADLDWLTAAQDPRVVAVVLARTTVRHGNEGWLRFLLADLADHGIPATEDRARALLDAVQDYDLMVADDGAFLAPDEQSDVRARLITAVTAIVGEQP